ncbi:MAG: hypothetical protein A2W34_03625 [Chloroflexi bacterium RBG_16_64_32]|nr:MAG: hypothetical protein A2W34_03625 [Chloroflexi bacterium RBG_16_64_32]
MQVVLETDEAWSLMSVIASHVIDNSGISQDGKAKIRRWRSDRGLGTVEMDDLAPAFNQALGTYLDDRRTRMIRRRGRYVSTRDLKGTQR